MTQLSLGDISVTAAASQVTEWVAVDDDADEILIAARFLYGSGGTTAKLYIQTLLPDGVTIMDIACIVFGTANAVKAINLSRQTPVTTAKVPTDGALADDTVIDGVIGSKLRSRVISTGTYAGSTVVSVRGQTTP